MESDNPSEDIRAAKKLQKIWDKRETRSQFKLVTALLEVSGLRRARSSSSPSNIDHIIAKFDCDKKFRPAGAAGTLSRWILKLEKHGLDTANLRPEFIEEGLEWGKWTTEVSDCLGTPVGDDNVTPSKVLNRAWYYVRFPGLNDYGVVLSGRSAFPIEKRLEDDGKPTYEPEVVSSIGCSKLRRGDKNRKFNLEEIAKNSNNVEFSGGRQPLIFTLREPKSTGYLHRNGRLIVVGTKSREDLTKASRRYARIIEKAEGQKVGLSKCSLNVCLGFVALPFRVRVDAMKRHKQLPQTMRADRDRGAFKGAILNVSETSAVVFIQASGSVLISVSGVDNFGCLKETLDLIYPCLRSFGF